MESRTSAPPFGNGQSAVGLRLVAEQRAAEQPRSLTPREVQIAWLMCEGLGDKEIAARLTISINTVRTYTRRMYDVLQVHGRAELVFRLLQEEVGREARARRAVEEAFEELRREIGNVSERVQFLLEERRALVAWIQALTGA